MAIIRMTADEMALNEIRQEEYVAKIMREDALQQRQMVAKRAREDPNVAALDALNKRVRTVPRAPTAPRSSYTPSPSASASSQGEGMGLGLALGIALGSMF